MHPAFELKPPEIPIPIAFREGGRKFRVTHLFRPPQFADWLEYELKLNRSVETVGAQTRFDQQKADAAEALWDRIALRVEGYLVNSNPQIAQMPQMENATSDSEFLESVQSAKSVDLPVAFPDDWQSKVPLLHKMAAVQLLAQVFPADTEETEAYHFNPDQVEVSLIAARGGHTFPDLVHILRRPTVRQQKEFSRIVSTALYVRGSRTEKSLLPSRLREMTRFYDDLVVAVRGYSVHGKHATHDDAIHAMDALHKQTAIAALFNFEEPDDAEEANEAKEA